MCQQALEVLKQVLDRMNLSYPKVAQPATFIRFLGMEISNDGWKLDTSNHPKLMDLRIESKDSLRSALGLVQYLSSAYTDVSFTQHFVVLSQLLKNTKNFVLGEEQKEAWRFFQNSSDEKSISFGVENPLKDSEYWVLQTDASDMEVAVVLWKTNLSPPLRGTREFLTGQ